MNFSPLQVGVTAFSFLFTLIIAYFWHIKDKNLPQSESKTESFPVLMSVFFWSASLTLFLKMGISLIIYFNMSLAYENWLNLLTIFMEELVKIVALIIGLNIADKRFNEISDGVMYTVLSALGFIFVENIAYVLTFSSSFTEFIIITLERNLFSFSAHLSTVIFGICYATAYLKTSKQLLTKLKKRQESRIAPYRIDKMYQFLWDKYGFMVILWTLFAPFVLVYQVINKKDITMSEMLVGGFLFSVYLHITYNYLLDLNITWLNTITLSVFGILGLFLYKYFPRLDVK